MRPKTAVITTLAFALLVLVPTSKAAAQTLTGPLLAYMPASGDRVIVDDLGAGTSREYPATGQIAWSPQGDRVAVGDHRSGLVVVVEIGTGVITQVADDYLRGDDGGTGGLDWTPDGAAVAYPNGFGGDVVAVAADGSGARRLLSADVDELVYSVDLSPDGQRMVVESCDDEGFCGARLFSATTGQFLSPLGEITGYDWSPDGQELAFSFSGAQLSILEVATLEERTIQESPSQQLFLSLLWKPDGSLIAFGQERGNGQSIVFGVSPDGCCAAEPLPVGTSGLPASWSPDGQLMAIAQDDFGGPFAVAEVGTGNQLPLPGGGGSTELATPVFAPTVPGGSAPGPVLPDTVTRLSGPERIATAIAIARQQWPDDGAIYAVLARADVAADALAATPLAARGGPTLLTGTDTLPTEVAEELLRVLPPDSVVYLAGGDEAISARVAEQVNDLGFEVQRRFGSDRFSTAVALAEQVAPDPDVIFLADGGGFAEALISGVAAARMNGVVVLTGGDTLPTATSTYLDDHQSAELVAVGPAAASASSGRAARVVAGSDAYETSQLLARDAFANPDVVALASGERFPDALSGGAHAARLGIPLLLTTAEQLPAPVDAYLSEVRASRIFIYGGPAAISDGVAADAARHTDA